MNRNLILYASMLAGVSYWLVMGHQPHGPGLVAWKASGVGLLALWALAHEGRAARTIGLVMALGAVADVAIEFSFIAGGAIFFVGHLIAIGLYLGNARPVLKGSQRMAAFALLLMVPLLAWQLSCRIEIGLYGLGLGAMAGTAWASWFSRYRVGVGALAFVASDLLIFARMGPLAGSVVPHLLVMPLYYIGQLMICTGVVRAMAQPGSNTAPSAAR
ncbi:MAG: lysoplasmalogenase [Proteobacteria bacterium]|nr:lysoplasmalogenase [Pseudomonadota bacterium]